MCELRARTIPRKRSRVDVIHPRSSGGPFVPREAVPTRSGGVRRVRGALVVPRREAPVWARSRSAAASRPQECSPSLWPVGLLKTDRVAPRGRRHARPSVRGLDSAEALSSGRHSPEIDGGRFVLTRVDRRGVKCELRAPTRFRGSASRADVFHPQPSGGPFVCIRKRPCAFGSAVRTAREPPQG
jgi:hypothetical protein